MLHLKSKQHIHETATVVIALINFMEYARAKVNYSPYINLISLLIAFKKKPVSDGCHVKLFTSWAFPDYRVSRDHDCSNSYYQYDITTQILLRVLSHLGRVSKAAGS